MVYGMRIPFFWVSVIFIFLWTFLPLFKKADLGYSISDFNEDMSKLYFDLGLFSQRRGDFEKAIKSYTLALDHNPESSICFENLEFCKKQLKNKISNTVNFISKLDRFK